MAVALFTLGLTVWLAPRRPVVAADAGVPPPASAPTIDPTTCAGFFPATFACRRDLVRPDEVASAEQRMREMFDMMLRDSASPDAAVRQRVASDCRSLLDQTKTEGCLPGGLGPFFAWESDLGTVTADLDGDGVEDLVGAFEVHQAGERKLFVGAFRGRDLRPLWRAGPFGLLNERFELRIAHTGAWIAVAGAGKVVRVLDARSGRVLHQTALADITGWLCPDAQGEPVMGISGMNGGLLRLDLRTGATRPVQELRPCRADTRAPWDRAMPDRGPRLGGRPSSAAVTLGAVGLARYAEGAGSYPDMVTLAGFDTRSPEFLWMHALPRSARVGFADKHLQLLEGRAYTLYDMPDKSGRLIALDWRTGRIVWEAVLPSPFSVEYADAFVVTPSRVYVPIGAVHVFDVRTGARIGAIGG